MNSKEYQTALTQGVAHAKGTSLPDQPGNTFLFAHSSDSFFNANTYNAVFYLLNKLQPDDIFYIAYKEKLYKYAVVKAQVVKPTEINYYDKIIEDADQTVTLMTCWPPATTVKRLIIVGVLRY
jgi:sortase A